MKMLGKILCSEFLLAAVGLSQGLVISPASLTFSAPAGAASTPPQTIALKSTASPLEVSYSTTVVTGSIWLSVSPSAGRTPSTVTVSVNPTGLFAGTYHGSVAITPAGGSGVVVPVTLTIAVSTITVSPLQLSFNYQINGPVPSPQTLQVSGTSGVTFSVQATTSSGGNWLSVNPSSATTPAAISVSVSPSNLELSMYQGTITVSDNGHLGKTVVSVGLTMTVPDAGAVIFTVRNAASFYGQAISPGEAVSIFGLRIGPLAPLGLQLDSTGNVSTSLGNAQVLFSGYLAPLTYVSATQINCVVPYEIAGISNPSVQVNYVGEASNAIALASALTLPGIFTANGSGTGPGAILNQDGSVNGPTNPEAAGNIVSVFMTGEGQTSPPGVTGSVTCRTGCNTLQQIPVPRQPVTATVGNRPATVTFYGEAPGLVSGVLQVNLIVPPNTPPGAAPLVISVGGTNSQPAVTLSVR
jgi:uncharacterized protein (TIGR03437 family)